MRSLWQRAGSHPQAIIFAISSNVHPNFVSAQPLIWIQRLALFVVIVCLPLQGLAVAVERLQGMLHTHRPMNPELPMVVELDLSVLHHDLSSKRRVHSNLTPAHGHADELRHHHDATDHTVVVSVETRAAVLPASATSVGKRLLIDSDAPPRFAAALPAPGASLPASPHLQQWSSSVDPRRLERPPRLV